MAVAGSGSACLCMAAAKVPTPLVRRLLLHLRHVWLKRPRVRILRRRDEAGRGRDAYSICTWRSSLRCLSTTFLGLIMANINKFKVGGRFLCHLKSRLCPLD